MEHIQAPPQSEKLRWHHVVSQDFPSWLVAQSCGTAIRDSREC